MIQCFEV